MIRYYRKPPALRATESRRTAQRLTRKGWRRITGDEHRAVWRVGALRRLQELEVGNEVDAHAR